MTRTINKTLLALSLALKNLELPLNQIEQEAFRNAAEQLQLDPDSWQDHELDLLSVIQHNSTLSQLYQIAKSQVDAINGNIPSNLLPTQAELEKVLPKTSGAVTRGFAPVSEDFDSNEINNMVISILTTPNPPETVKKLNSFEQLQQFLQKCLSSQ